MLFCVCVIGLYDIIWKIYEVEINVMMNWIKKYLFVLLVSLYGGLFVVNYFFDGYFEGCFFFNFILDDDVFCYLVIIYVNLYLLMYYGKLLCLGFFVREEFFKGIINGVVW